MTPTDPTSDPSHSPGSPGSSGASGPSGPSGSSGESGSRDPADAGVGAPSSGWLDAERAARGAALFEDVYAGLMAAPEPGSMDFSDMMLAQLFAEHWGRDQLDRRARRLLTLGIVAAAGDAGAWSIHLEAALRNGEITPVEAREAVLHVSQYAGYPKASPLLIATEQVISRVPAPDPPTADAPPA